MSLVPLTDLSFSQMDLILQKFQLYAPSNYDGEDRLNLLNCNVIYRKYFENYESSEVLAKFSSKGKFMDFQTTDEEITGIFSSVDGSNTLLYPCVLCCCEVTDKNDKTGNGLHCSGCENYFHNACCDHPISEALFKALKDSPSFVKTFCKDCNISMIDTSQRLKRVDKKMSEVRTKVNTISDVLETNKSQYSQVLANGTPPSSVSGITKKIVKQLAAQNSAAKEKESKLRDKCSLLVRKPMDKNIRNSKDIRKAFNKEFPGIVIVNCRITAGGSIKIELDNEDDVKKVSENWKSSLFGGNSGITPPQSLQTSGIVKHVYVDCTEEEIEQNIKSNYNVSKVEIFKKNGEMTGTVKVTFNSQKDLQDVTLDRIKIFAQRYLMEEYKPSPRVIKCHRCQGFGHIARLCRSNLPKCGKCGETSHESDSCTSSVLKCAHCNENHITGDKSCKVMKQKLEQIKERYNYGL